MKPAAGSLIVLAVLMTLSPCTYAIAPPLPPMAEQFTKLGLEGGALFKRTENKQASAGVLLHVAAGWRLSHHFMMGGMLNVSGQPLRPQDGLANLLFHLIYYPSEYAFYSPLRIETGLGPSMGSDPDRGVAWGASLIVSASMPLITPDTDMLYDHFFGGEGKWFFGLGAQLSYQGTFLFPDSGSRQIHSISIGLYIEWQLVNDM